MCVYLPLCFLRISKLFFGYFTCICHVQEKAFYGKRRHSVAVCVYLPLCFLRISKLFFGYFTCICHVPYIGVAHCNCYFTSQMSLFVVCFFLCFIFLSLFYISSFVLHVFICFIFFNLYCISFFVLYFTCICHVTYIGVTHCNCYGVATVSRID